MLYRIQDKYAKSKLYKGKALLIFGPRQVGKTTFVQNLVADKLKTTLFLNGDETDVRELYQFQIKYSPMLLVSFFLFIFGL